MNVIDQDNIVDIPNDSYRSNETQSIKIVLLFLNKV